MPDTDLELDDTQEIPVIAGFSPWDGGPSSFGVRLLDRAAAQILDNAAFARIQFESMATMVEAFAVAVVIDPDEPIPYVLTEKAKQLLATAGR
jgi:hypothetical protein